MDKRIILKTFFAFAVITSVSATATITKGTVIYVDDDADGANDGSSWQNAYVFLQDALMMASSGDEIRVAQGIYKPDQFILSKRANLGRMETFQLINGVIIRGGYAGFGEPDPDVSDIVLFKTILSGDIDIGRNDDILDNSYHVVTGSGTDANAVLDGFTITAGQADGPKLNDLPEYDSLRSAAVEYIIFQATLR